VLFAASLLLATTLLAAAFFAAASLLLATTLLTAAFLAAASLLIALLSSSGRLNPFFGILCSVHDAFPIVELTDLRPSPLRLDLF
jgi:hypothetical protein